MTTNNVLVQLQYRERVIATDTVEVQMSNHSKQHDKQQVVYMIHREMNYSVLRLFFFTQMNFAPCKIALLGVNTRVRCENKIVLDHVSYGEQCQTPAHPCKLPFQGRYTRNRWRCSYKFYTGEITAFF